MSSPRRFFASWRNLTNKKPKIRANKNRPRVVCVMWTTRGLFELLLCVFEMRGYHSSRFFVLHAYALAPSMTTSQPSGIPLTPRDHPSVLVTNVPWDATPEVQFG